MLRRRTTALQEFVEAPAPRMRLLVITAHPDDEVIGAGAQLLRWPDAYYLNVTDGAPRNMSDARAAGFTSRKDYALARRSELQQALALAGVGPEHVHCFSVADQEASFRLADITQLVAARILDFQPDVVLTHAYEGGHPDHDATAFASHVACAVLRREGIPDPILLEMTGYFNQAGSMATSQFLPNPIEWPQLSCALSPAQKSLKKRMFSCFRTQQRVLENFPIDSEVFRPAPEYQFLNPPHAGRLYYELFDWGIKGVEWRRNAHEALVKLGFYLTDEEESSPSRYSRTEAHKQQWVSQS